MLKRISGASAGKARLMNIALLIAGYGFGQGSIFLAQTWLVAKDKLELLAQFGTHFSFAMFGIILVEAGSLTILARHSALMANDEGAATGLWRIFWETSVFRAILAALAIAAIAIWLMTVDTGDFSRNYALLAAPALLIWSVNAAGFLDGLKLSGISGLTGSVAYVASAIALLLAEDASSYNAGLILGGAFSAGYALTVLIQIAALHKAGWKLHFERPTSHGISRSAREGLALLGSTLPGQLYFRVQLFISSTWLGVDPTAVFVYVKQITVAVSQLIGFIRRVEFPALVRILGDERKLLISKIFQSQRLGTYISVAGAVTVFLTGIFLSTTKDRFAEIGQSMAFFSIVIISGNLSSMFFQGLSALGHYGRLMFLMTASSIIGMAISVILPRFIGLSGFAIADVIANLLIVATSIVTLRRITNFSSTPRV